MVSPKVETKRESEPDDDDDPRKCDLCLERKVCMDRTDPMLDGKDVHAMVGRHLRIQISLTYVCRRCWSRLDDFDNFYRMVTEQHSNVRIKTDSDDLIEEADAMETDQTVMMEFVEIKREPPGDEVKEEREPIQESFVDKLSPEHSAEEDNGDLKEDDSNSVSSRDSEDSYVPSRNRGSSGSKSVLKKKPKIEHDILEFYKRLVCEICDAEQMLAGEPSVQYNNLRELNKHMRKVHNQVMASITCPMCDKKFRSRAKLLEHREMHLYPDRFRCAVCLEVHQNLVEHMKNKHQERTFCCEECGKRFPFKARLSAHIRKMHTAKDVVCDQCQKSFSKYTIEDHKRAVHGSRFICEHCPRTFKTRFSLEQHMDEHVEGLRSASAVPCDVCGVVLRNKYNLLSHVKRMHTEHPPVSCGTCGKVFKSKHNLQAHLTNVCTERTFPCPICGKQFKKKIKLKEHMTTHTKSALYQCPYCPKTFSFETQLYTHRKQAHHEQWLEMQRKRKEGVRFKVQRVTDMPSV